MKEQKTRRRRGGFRLCDDSLTHAGYRKGDVLLVKLHATPKAGDLCAAFTAWGEVVIRYYHPRPNGDVTLATGRKDEEVLQVFGPKAVIIFGPVIGVCKGGVS